MAEQNRNIMSKRRLHLFLLDCHSMEYNPMLDFSAKIGVINFVDGVAEAA